MALEFASGDVLLDLAVREAQPNESYRDAQDGANDERQHRAHISEHRGDGVSRRCYSPHTGFFDELVTTSGGVLWAFLVVFDLM